jgi:hypothetical protein
MPQKTGDDLSCPGRVRSFCSTGGIRRVTLVTNSETTKSLPSTALAIYVSYLLSHFPPHPSLSRLRQLLTKLLLTTTLVI